MYFIFMNVKDAELRIQQISLMKNRLYKTSFKIILKTYLKMKITQYILVFSFLKISFNES